MGDSAENEVTRTLPDTITIPEINGEMVHLRPATMEDCAIMDELEAYYNASAITGKDAAAERALVHTWVGRSVAWAQGLSSHESGVGDPESRRTIAWAVVADPTGEQEPKAGKVIGMIFLIDIDGWGQSARIQIMLGKDYRGRGYSRDAMPRVMTYGFAWAPAGLGMHRIWVAVPEKNTRSLSVYQSLGFMVEGTSRDALWDDAEERYQDQVVLGTLADEFDPIRSLDAFGMHLIEDNPGVREALAAREHSMSIMRDRVARQLHNQQGAGQQGAGQQGAGQQGAGQQGAGQSAASQQGMLTKSSVAAQQLGEDYHNAQSATSGVTLQKHGVSNNGCAVLQDGEYKGTQSAVAGQGAASAGQSADSAQTANQQVSAQNAQAEQINQAAQNAQAAQSRQERDTHEAHETNADLDANLSADNVQGQAQAKSQAESQEHAKTQEQAKAQTQPQDQEQAQTQESTADQEQHNTKGGSSWSYADNTVTHSKRAWWRNLGKGRTRENNE